jgi:hypothetical protein
MGNIAKISNIVTRHYNFLKFDSRITKVLKNYQGVSRVSSKYNIIWTHFRLGFGLPIIGKEGNQRVTSLVSIGSDLSIYQEKKKEKHTNQSKLPITFQVTAFILKNMYKIKKNELHMKCKHEWIYHQSDKKHKMKNSYEIKVSTAKWVHSLNKYKNYWYFVINFS